MSDHKSCCPPVDKGGCSNTGSCCGSSRTAHKEIVVDFLYIDLSVCDRCKGTGEALSEAIEDVRKILEAAGCSIIVNYVHVQTEEQAEELGFTSSPTIRINGQDIQMDIKETLCESCGDLCGDDIDCRVWVYGGKEYTIPPKPMIVNAILGYIYSSDLVTEINYTTKSVPENLRKFFARGKVK